MDEMTQTLRGGLNKLWLGEILILAGAALTIVPMLGMATPVVQFVGGLVVLLGALKLKNSQEGYLKAFMFALWILVLTGVGMFLKGQVKMVIDLALAVLVYLQMNGMVSATNHFFREQGESKMVEMGEQAKRLYLNALVVYIVLVLSTDIMAGMLTALLLTVFEMLTLAAFIAGRVYYVMYLGKAKSTVAAQRAIEGM